MKDGSTGGLFVTLPINHRTPRGDMHPMERSLVEQIRDSHYWLTASKPVSPKYLMAGVTYASSVGTVGKYIEAHQWELSLRYTREQIVRDFAKDGEL